MLRIKVLDKPRTVISKALILNVDVTHDIKSTWTFKISSYSIFPFDQTHVEIRTYVIQSWKYARFFDYLRVFKITVSLIHMACVIMTFCLECETPYLSWLCNVFQNHDKKLFQRNWFNVTLSNCCCFCQYGNPKFQ